MAQQIINNLLNSEISAEDIVYWLTTDKSEESKDKSWDELCSKADFALYFLNFLKSQFTCLPQVTSTTNQIDKIELKNNDEKIVKLDNSTNKSINKIETESNTLPHHVSTPTSHQIKLNGVQHMRLNSPNCTDEKASSTIKTSTPILNRQQSGNNLNIFEEGNSLLSPKATNEQGNKSLDLLSKRLTNNSNKSFEIAGTHKQHSFTHILRDSVNSSVSDITNDIASNDTINSRSCQSKNSTSLNETCLSPGSPFKVANQSVSVFTPKQQQDAKNKTSSGSSKKKYSNNKSGKYTPRQTFSLGDFITMDPKSAKKNDKKNNDSNKSDLKQNNDESSSKFLVNDEMFPQIDSNPRRKRRIKPTAVETKDNNEQTPFGTITRPPTVNLTFTEVLPTDQSTDSTTFEKERELLKLERQKKPEQNSTKKDCLEIKTPNKTPSKIIPASLLIVPSLHLVDNTTTLDKLIEVYCTLWNCNLIMNPMSELYFVIYLITLKYVRKQRPIKKLSIVRSIIETTNTTNDSSCNKLIIDNDESIVSKKLEDSSLKSIEDDLGCTELDDNCFSNKTSVQTKLMEMHDKDDESIDSKDVKEEDEKNVGLFDSPHNCVYFACCVLYNQRELVTTLDKATLKLLAEHCWIASFKPELCEFLNEKYNFKSSVSQKTKQATIAKMDESNVCFQMDTDNAENFSSVKAFRIFHKQRDIFYEIFHEWDENHLLPNWNCSTYLGPKIQNMLLLHNDISNYYHFARLFKSQLMSSCLKSDQEEPLDEENMSLLKTLKHVNMEKLTQLTERLFKPLTSNGPAPVPMFHGKQEFFREFIILANNHMFNHHLQNCLVHEILELDDIQLVKSEMENEDIIVDDYTKQLFIKNVSSLRLLAKFLGFLIALPYKSETSMTDVVIASQILLRSHIMPPLNVQECIRNSIRQGRLSLTLPWVVEYLAMLDITTLSLPYYLQILEFLYYIYRACDNLCFKNDAIITSRQTVLLGKFLIGWLFELPNFPKQHYYSWQLSYTKEKLKAICNYIDDNPSIAITEISNQNRVNLDKLDIIDDTILYLCCPFLSELKILLLTGKSNLNNANTTRHITPITSELKKEINDSKQLQMQLEEAFFNGQPSSTRKIVDFVSERVASCCTKYICYIVLPQQKEEMLIELRDLTNKVDITKMTNQNKAGVIKNILDEDMISLSNAYVLKIKNICQTTVYEMCENRVKMCIDALLPEDALQQVKDTCVGIAVRIALQNVKKWVLTHIVEGELFVKEMNIEVNKIIKNVNTKSDREVQHDPQAVSPTVSINLLRDCILNLLEEKGKSFTLESVIDLLRKVEDSLLKRKDLLPIPEKVLFSLTIDYALCLLTYRPDLMTNDIQKLFIDLWKRTDFNVTDNDSPITRILAPRNILLLEKSKAKETWTNLAIFIKRLLENQLLTIDCLSDQCVAVFRDEWQVTTLQNLSKFLTEVISDMKSLKQQEDTERIRTLLEWVAGAYNDIEFFDY